MLNVPAIADSPTRKRGVIRDELCIPSKMPRRFRVGLLLHLRGRPRDQLSAPSFGRTLEATARATGPYCPACCSWLWRRPLLPLPLVLVPARLADRIEMPLMLLSKSFACARLNTTPATRAPLLRRCSSAFSTIGRC